MTDNNTATTRRPRRAKQEAKPKSRWTEGAGEKWRAHSDASRWSGDSFVTGTENPFAIDAESIAIIERGGVKLQWFVDTVYGKQEPDVGRAEQNGWRRVSMDEGFPGVSATEVGGMVLMARPMAIHEKAERQVKSAAEAAPIRLRQKAGEGDLPMTGADHPSAKRFNKHRKSVERFDVPSAE